MRSSYPLDGLLVADLTDWREAKTDPKRSSVICERRELMPAHFLLFKCAFGAGGMSAKSAHLEG